MYENKVVNLEAGVILVLVVAPTVIGVAFSAIGHIAVGVGNVINRVKYNNKIKKGLKDGSIIEIDGLYYEVENVEEA